MRRGYGNNGGMIFAVALGIVLAIPFLVAFIAYGNSSAPTAHAPIIIEGNSDFTFANGVIAGSGTLGDPYIIQGWDIDGGGTENYGVYISGTNAYFVIRDLRVHNVYYDAVHLGDCWHGTVESCEISTSDTGLFVGAWSGETCGDILIANNVITSNQNYGLFAVDCNPLVVTGNTISSTIYGWGLYVTEASDVLVYHNNFESNTPLHAVTDQYGIVTWDNGYPSGGNYWDDYTGVDMMSGVNQDQTGSDGIGDTPREVDVQLGSGDYDRYPLMVPYALTPVPEFPTLVLPVACTIAVFLVLGVLRKRSDLRP